MQFDSKVWSPLHNWSYWNLLHQRYQDERENYLAGVVASDLRPLVDVKAVRN